MINKTTIEDAIYHLDCTMNELEYEKLELEEKYNEEEDNDMEEKMWGIIDSLDSAIDNILDVKKELEKLLNRL